MKYYDRIVHTNTADTETRIYERTSGEEERIRINTLNIFREANRGIMRMYDEREHFATLPTGEATITNRQVIEIERELRIGQTFRITLQNVVAGTHSGVFGFIEFEII